MVFGGVVMWTAAVSLSLILQGCGLNGVRGTVLSIDQNQYVIRDYGGTVWAVHADDASHRDRVQVDDEVRVYIGGAGHAAYIQKVEQ